MQDLFSRQPPLYAKPRPKSQPYTPDSVSQSSGQGHLSSAALSSDHGHVNPPVVPPKPQPAHASSALGSVRSPASSSGAPAVVAGVGGLVSATVAQSGLSSAPLVAGTPPSAPPTFAPRDISHSVPASNPQTPQTLSYGVAHATHPQLANVSTQFMPLVHHSRVATVISRNFLSLWITFLLTFSFQRGPGHYTC